jgi:hypothetical protein
MPSPSKRRAPPREVPLTELEAAIRKLLATGAGITPAALKKAFPKSYKKPEHERATGLLRELVARNEIHRWSKGKKEIFFARDPIATLDSVAVESLAAGPLTSAALKTAVKARAPGHEDLLTEWLNNAVPRRLLFKQGNKYSRELDIRDLLKKEIATLQKALQRIKPLDINRARIAEVVLEALGLPAARRTPSTNGTPRTDRFLTALSDLAAENPRGALLSLRDLRARLSMSKDEFDETALRLQREGAVSLHHHDHALALSEAERAVLVRDGTAGEHYVGIALKEKEGT